MTRMAEDMCAGSSGASSEPALLLLSGAAQLGKQPLLLSRQVLGVQVDSGSPRKIWTGDSMVEQLQLEGEVRRHLRGCGSERTGWIRRGKLWPGQCAEPRRWGHGDRWCLPRPHVPQNRTGRRTSICRHVQKTCSWVPVGQRAFAPFPKLLRCPSPFPRHGPLVKLPLWSPRFKRPRAQSPRSQGQSLESPKLTSGTWRRAEMSRGRPSRCWIARCRVPLSLRGRCAPGAPRTVRPLPSSLTRAPFQPIAVPEA